MTQDPHTCAATDECRHAAVRECFVVADGCWVLRQVSAEISVCDEKTGSDPGQRNQPLRVREPEPCGTGPNLFLVLQKVSCQPCETVMRCRREVLFHSDPATNFLELFLSGGSSITLSRNWLVLFFGVLLLLSGKNHRTRQHSPDEPSKQDHNVSYTSQRFLITDGYKPPQGPRRRLPAPPGRRSPSCGRQSWAPSRELQPCLRA